MAKRIVAGNPATPNPPTSGNAKAEDAAYQRFFLTITNLPPWSVWDDESCAGPIGLRLTREVISDHEERAVFGAFLHGGRHWSVSVPLAQAVMKDAQERSGTIQPELYSPTVANRMVTAYRNLAQRIARELERARETSLRVHRRELRP